MVRKTLEGGWLRVVRVNDQYLWYQLTKAEELVYEREVKEVEPPHFDDAPSALKFVLGVGVGD